MKQLFKKTLLMAALLICGALGLKAQFIISGEFRPRFEYRDGYLRIRDPSMTPYFTIPGRNRISFDYKSERFQARFSIQHAYVFGDNNYSSDTITKNTINIYEGWFRYNFTNNFAMKIGRTELSYDDGRLLGNSNWGPKGAVHDVAMLQWEVPGQNYRGDVGFAINNTSPATPYLQPYPMKNYKYMGYLYEQRKFLKEKLTVSMLAVLDVYQKPASTVKTTSTHYDTLYITNPANDTIGTTVIPTTTSTSVTTSYPDQLYGRFTIGGTVGYASGKLKLFASGYWQTGHFLNGKKLNAGMIGVYASYQLLKRLNLLAGYDYLSGNNYSDTTGFKTKSTAFSTLYPSSHGFYGYMDLFSAINAIGISPGLTDLYLKATVTLSEKAFLEGTWRFFGLAQGYLQSGIKRPGDLPYVSVGKTLGSEIDLMAVYKPHKSIEFNAAYCFFLPTGSMETFEGLAPGTARFAQYAYLMITFKPTFFRFIQALNQSEIFTSLTKAVMLPENLHISDYHYDLPPERIAQFPLPERDGSRLLVYRDGEVAADRFLNISEILEPGCHLVFNETRVIRARILFTKSTGAVIEIFCLEPVAPVAEIEHAFNQPSGVVWNCLVGNAKRWKTGVLQHEFYRDGKQYTLFARLVSVSEAGHHIEFSWDPPQPTFSEILALNGLVPLPPYIHRDTNFQDDVRYQTIFARYEGSVAAPTAGLHFTPRVMEALSEKGIKCSGITLHVGIGTFKPVTAVMATDHNMHPEHFSVSRQAVAELITENRRKVIAVGTTTTRTLESLYWFGCRIIREGGLIHHRLGQWHPYMEPDPLHISANESMTALLDYMDRHGMTMFMGETSLMIVPGYRFRMVSGLITNFHMPQSTLLLLVAALAGPGWKDAYLFALRNDFRFLSYGDSCLFLGQDH